MRFLSRFSSSKSSVPNRRRRFEALENRELLAATLTPSDADYAALSAANAFVSDAENDVSAIWVTTLSDKSTATDGKISLREALDYAGTTLNGQTVSSTIRFSVGGTITLAKTLTINKNVAVDASDVDGGIVVDRAKSGSVLLIYGGSTSDERAVSLTGLTITGGSTTGAYQGTGVYLGAFCNLTAFRCSIVGNVSESGIGVGVYVKGGKLTTIDSVVANNGATGATSVGGGIYVDSGSLTAIRTTFDANFAGVGGGVYVKGGAASFDGSTFVGNNASAGSGGALHNFAGVLDVSNGSFRDNSASNSGGAIYNAGLDGAETEIVDAFFVGNVAKNGGAIYNAGEALKLKNVEARENVANEDGGALYVAANSELNVVDSNFIDNVAARNAGALYNAGILNVDNAQFAENQAQERGGALFSSGYFEVRDADFARNDAEEGGAIFKMNGSNDASTSWLFRVNVENGSATLGGGLYNKGILTIADSTFSGDASTSGGGAVSNEGTLFISETKIVDNASNGAGGGVLNWNGATLVLSNATVAGNVSRNLNGGGLANFGSATVANVSFLENEAPQGFGGGLANGGSLDVQNTLFFANDAANGGGAINTVSGTAKFANSVFWRNVAKELGGALYCVGATAFEASYLMKNVAATAATAAYYQNPNAGTEPTFDSKTTIAENVAASSVVNVVLNENVVVNLGATAATVGASIGFGDFAVGESSATQTATIRNAGSAPLAFSQFSVVGVDADDVLQYSLQREDGSTVDPANFQLASGETIRLTLVVDPKKVGAKIFEFVWTTREIDAINPDATAKTVRIVADAEIAKGASASVSTDADAKIAFDESGYFTLSLKTKPTSNVVVYLQASDGVVLSDEILIFTPMNYLTPQSVSVNLSSDYLATGEFNDQIVVSPQILSFESAWRAATVPNVALKINDYIAFVGNSAVDLAAAAPQGSTHWDLDGDGVYETATNFGVSFWIDASAVAEKSAISFRTTTATGSTQGGSVDVVRVGVPQTVSGETSTFAKIPGAVRVALTAENGAIANWRIDWGDGSPLTIQKETATFATFAHYYSEDGDYEIRVELIDANGVGAGVWVPFDSLKISGVSTSSALFDKNAFGVSLDDSFDLSQDVANNLSNALLDATSAAITEKEKIARRRGGVFQQFGELFDN